MSVAAKVNHRYLMIIVRVLTAGFALLLEVE